MFRIKERRNFAYNLLDVFINEGPHETFLLIGLWMFYATDFHNKNVAKSTDVS